MEQKLTLNFHGYPLVTGQVDKYTFSDWQVEGSHIQLRAKRGEEELGDDTLVWTSSDPQVAVVDACGLVRGVRTGLATITASDPQGECDSCLIQVIDNNGRLMVETVTLNTDELVLDKESGAALYPQIWPLDLFQNGMLDPTFTWSSTDESVAVVDHRGRIYAKEVGETVIRAVSKDVGRTAECKVRVIKKSKEALYADPLEDLEGGRVALCVSQSETLKLPAKVQAQPVRWCSERPDVVRVDGAGRVTAFRPGTAKIWGTFVNGGWRIGYDVQVEALPKHPVTALSLSQQQLHMQLGEQKALYGVVFPATRLETALDWSSSDESIVRVVRSHINLSGLDEVVLEAVGVGSVSICGRCEGFEDSCEITVTREALRLTGIALPEAVTVQPQESMSLAAEVTVLLDGKARVLSLEELTQWSAANATLVPYKRTLAWISTNRNAVTVDREGTLSGTFVNPPEAAEATVYAVSVDSMTDAQLVRLLELQQCSVLSAAEQKELEQLLQGAVYASCQVHVEADSPYLYHLHIPVETITDTSVCLLWNKQAQTRTGELAAYEIYEMDAEGSHLIERTTAIGYTCRGLLPESVYEWEVRAVDASGQTLGAQRVTAETKAAPAVVLDVTKAPFCAVGDGVACDTYAIQKAIDACPAGGMVYLPSGFVFRSGALFLHSGQTFCVDGILFGSDDPADYPPVVCRWEGYRKLRLTEENEAATVPVFEENVYSHSSLINVGVYDEGEAGSISPYHTFDVTICGSGMINGNGFALAYNEGPCWFTLKRGLPIPQSPKTDQNIRGRVLAFYNTKRAYVTDVTIAYGPSWTVHPVFSEQITFDHVKVISMGDGRTGTMEGMLILNGDGIDPDSSRHVNIVDSYFTVGDDAVAIKSGRNRQGNELDKPSAYIRVTDCVCVDAKGSFAIGSEQSGGVHHVLFQNLTVRNLKNFGLWIKSAPCRGGLVEDVIMRDCFLQDTGGALQFEYNHGGTEDAAKTLPVTRRVLCENIVFSGTNKFGIRLMGHPESPISEVTFRDCSFTEDFRAKKAGKFVIQNCEEIHLERTTLPEGYLWEDRRP